MENTRITRKLLHLFLYLYATDSSFIRSLIFLLLLLIPFHAYRTATIFSWGRWINWRPAPRSIQFSTISDSFVWHSLYLPWYLFFTAYSCHFSPFDILMRIFFCSFFCSFHSLRFLFIFHSFISELTSCFVDIFADRHIRKIHVLLGACFFRAFCFLTLSLLFRSQCSWNANIFSRKKQNSTKINAEEFVCKMLILANTSANIPLSMMFYAFEIILLHLHGAFFLQPLTIPSISVNDMRKKKSVWKFFSPFSFLNKYHQTMWLDIIIQTEQKEAWQRTKESIAHLFRHFWQFSTLCGKQMEMCKAHLTVNDIFLTEFSRFSHQRATKRLRRFLFSSQHTNFFFCFFQFQLST